MKVQKGLDQNVKSEWTGSNDTQFFEMIIITAKSTVNAVASSAKHH